MDFLSPRIGHVYVAGRKRQRRYRYGLHVRLPVYTRANLISILGEHTVVRALRRERRPPRLLMRYYLKTGGEVAPVSGSVARGKIAEDRMSKFLTGLGMHAMCTTTVCDFSTARICARHLLKRLHERLPRSTARSKV